MFYERISNYRRIITSNWIMKFIKSYVAVTTKVL